jgi:hypothetical protein
MWKPGSDPCSRVLAGVEKNRSGAVCLCCRDKTPDRVHSAMPAPDRLEMTCGMGRVPACRCRLHVLVCLMAL